MAEAEQRPLTVACCLWGDWPEPGWGGEYVSRLRNAVARNLSQPHSFVCLADDVTKVPSGIGACELRPTFSAGCLPKLQIYAQNWTAPVLLFDLDNVITGPLDEMANYAGDFCVRARLPEWTRGERVPDGDMIMFRPPAAQRLWAAAMRDPEAVRQTGGRERFFIADAYPEADLWQSIVPGQVVSYKHHCRAGLPEDAKVVSFHGRPRPHECLGIPWVAEHWR